MITREGIERALKFISPERRATTRQIMENVLRGQPAKPVGEIQTFSFSIYTPFARPRA